jgi:uncharacterized protein (TIGR01244 family)
MRPLRSLAALAALLLASPLVGQLPAPLPSAPATIPAPPAAPPVGPFGIRNAAEIEPGLLVGGQPTAAQLRAIAAAGYKSVIDLRAPGEDRGFDETSLLAELGLPYVNVPVSGMPDAATVDRFLAELRRAERPLLLHCASSNRVGALLYAWYVEEQGLPPAEAMAKAKAAGLRSAELAAAVEALVCTGAGC